MPVWKLLLNTCAAPLFKGSSYSLVVSLNGLKNIWCEHELRCFWDEGKVCDWIEYMLLSMLVRTTNWVSAKHMVINSDLIFFQVVLFGFGGVLWM